MSKNQYTLETPQQFALRFWSKAIITANPDKCWIWTGTKTSHGYGVILIKNKRTIASRVAWELFYGAIPDGLLALHNCPDGDNPACCNPRHLFLGTQQDNVRDMLNKGRQAPIEQTVHHGEKHGMHKLTAIQVAEIRQRFATGGISKAQLGREYGVTDVQIYHIVTGKAWRV